MALRLVEIICGAASTDMVDAAIHHHELLNDWRETLDDDRRRFRLLLDAKEAEAVLDEIDDMLGASDLDFRATLLAVEATLPRIEQNDGAIKKNPTPLGRVGREEMYEDLKEGTEVTTPYLAYVVLSVIVAAIGLARNDTAVLVGAMVIAPLLTPNMSLALGTTLGDGPFVWKSLKVNVVGVVLAFALSLLIGWMVTVQPDLPSLETRTTVKLQDVALALAAGCAGAIALTTGAPSSLIGVMVAVALMPPLVASGLLIASGNVMKGLGAMELVAVNVISVNLAGVVTFLWQGIRPRTWWEAEKARRSVRVALTAWVLLLATLIALIVQSRQ